MSLGLLSTHWQGKSFFKSYIGHQASVIESFHCGGEGGTSGCEGFTRKGDQVDGVIAKGRKAGKRWKNKWKWKEVLDEVRVSEDGNVEMWWDKSVETSQKMKHNLPDVTVVDQVAQERTFILLVAWD